MRSVQKKFLFILLVIACFTTFIFHLTQQTRKNYFRGMELFNKGLHKESIPYFKAASEDSKAPALVHLYLGRALQWTGSLDEALLHLKQYAALKPDSFEGLAALAEVYSWKKDYPQSMNMYKKALKLKNDFTLRKQLADVYAWSGEFQRAETLYRSLILEKPGDPQLYSAITELLNGMKKSKEALAFVQKGMELSPGGAMTLLYAETLYYAGDFRAAQQILESVLKNSPSFTEAKILLAKTQMALQNYAGAISVLRGIPNPALAGIEKDLAAAYFYNSQFSESVPILQRHLAAHPSDTEARLMLAHAFHYGGQIREAVRLYEELQSGLLPESPAVEGGLGEISLQKGNYEAAIAHYRKVLVNTPENTKARLRLAGLLSWIKEYGESMEEYKKVLETDKDNFQARMELARVYKWKKDFASAETLYRDLIEKNPSLPELRNELAELLIWDKRSSEALSLLKSAGPFSAQDQNNLLLGKALLYSGKHEEARTLFQKMYDLFPQDPELKKLLAEAFTLNKDYDRAIGLYRELYAAAPHRDIRRQLALLYSWSGKYTESIRILEEMQSSGEADEQTRLQLARNYIYSGQAPKAIPILKELKQGKKGQNAP